MKRILSVLFLALLSVGLFAQPMVYTPELKAPFNNAVKQMPDVLLDWDAVTGQFGSIRYEVQYDTTAAFSSPELFDTIQSLLTAYKTHGLVFGANYFWRVRAIDGLASDWTPFRKFTVFSQLELDKPSNNATGQACNVSLSRKTKLSNTTISGIANFQLQVDTVNTFTSSGLVDEIVPGTTFSYQLSDLNFNKKYFWRVRALNASSNSDWSETWNFTVAASFALTSPVNNAVSQMINVFLKWKEVTGIVAYEYEIAPDENFTTLIVNKEVDTLAARAEMLYFGSTYYWRTRVRNFADTSDWSPVWSFTTTDSVNLKTPSNGAVNIAQKPTLKWVEMTGQTQYQLQVDTLNTFAAPIVEQFILGSKTEYDVTHKLALNKIHYWRMRAIVNSEFVNDTSSWGETWSFTTAATTGMDEVSGMKNLSIYPNPASGKIFVRVNSNKTQTISISIMDLVGKYISKGDWMLSSGENTKAMDINNLDGGIYIIRIQAGDEVINQKLIVK